MKKNTRLTTAGRKPEANHGIVNPPVYHASTVIFPTVEALEKAEKTPFDGVYYGRFGTPTTFAFEEAVADLEGGEQTVSMPSGLAAIFCALMTFLKTGDHVLVCDSVYHPTRRLCDGMLRDLGIRTTYYDPLIGGDIGSLMEAETRVVFVESPGSLTFEVQDIPAIAKAAHDRGAVVLLDNTWSAGIFFEPFKHGVDVSIQAATKYIVGHADAMLGTVTTTGNLCRKVKKTAVGMGLCAGPDDCYLGLRGLRSLAARLARHQQTGLDLAHWLEGRDEVARVLHPGLTSFPGHEIWKRDFSGASGLFGMVLKENYSSPAVAAMLDGLDLFSMGFSWGGYESLILPCKPAQARSIVRWTDRGACIRIHAGLEDVDDLKDDLERGFERLNSAGLPE